MKVKFYELEVGAQFVDELGDLYQKTSQGAAVMVGPKKPARVHFNDVDEVEVEEL